MESTLDVAHYLTESVFPEDIPERAIAEAFAARCHDALIAGLSQPLNEEMISRVVRYSVPQMTPDGCSRLDGSLQEEPYELSDALNIDLASEAGMPALKHLGALDSGVAFCTEQLGIDWLGVYSAQTLSPNERVLLKLVYRGVPSRAEFPLTWEFARNSNNSTVGLTGTAVIINDIEQYLWDKGGPYYQCDSKVLSEACLPIFRPGSADVIGICDAESWERNTFSAECVARLSGFCVALAPLLENFQREVAGE